MAIPHKLQQSDSRQNQSAAPTQASTATETVSVLGSSAGSNTPTLTPNTSLEKATPGIRARLVDSPEPPCCQGKKNSRRELKMWAKVKGMTIQFGPAAKPNLAWKCGTDEVFPITDPAYYKALGCSAPPEGYTVFACKHAIAEFAKAEKTA